METERTPSRKRAKGDDKSAKDSAGADGQGSQDVILTNELKWFPQTNFFKVSFKDGWDDTFTTTPKFFGQRGLADFFSDNYLDKIEPLMTTFSAWRIVNMTMKLHNFVGYTRNFNLTGVTESNSTQNTPNGFVEMCPTIRTGENGLIRYFQNGDLDSVVKMPSPYIPLLDTAHVRKQGTKMSSELIQVATFRTIEQAEVPSYLQERNHLPTTTQSNPVTNEFRIPTFVPQTGPSSWRQAFPSHIHNRNGINYRDMSGMKDITMTYPDTPWMSTQGAALFTDENPTIPYVIKPTADTLKVQIKPYQYANIGSRTVMHTWPKKMLPVLSPRQNYINPTDKIGGAKSNKEFCVLAALPHTDQQGTLIPQFFNVAVEITCEYEFKMTTDLAFWTSSDALSTNKQEQIVQMPIVQYNTNTNASEIHLETQIL